MWESPLTILEGGSSSCPFSHGLWCGVLTNFWFMLAPINRGSRSRPLIPTRIGNSGDCLQLALLQSGSEWFNPRNHYLSLLSLWCNKLHCHSRCMVSKWLRRTNNYFNHLVRKVGEEMDYNSKKLCPYHMDANRNMPREFSHNDVGLHCFDRRNASYLRCTKSSSCLAIPIIYLALWFYYLEHYHWFLQFDLKTIFQS